MWSNLLSAALLYGVLSTTIVVAQFPSSPFVSPSPTDPHQIGAAPTPAVSTDLSTPSGGAEPSSSAGGALSAGAVPTRPALKSGSPDTPAPSKKSNNTGAIAGGVVGGVVLLIIVGALIFFLRKRKRASDPFGSMEKSPDERAVSNESPPPIPPVPIGTASASPHPHHSPTTPNEAHALMSHYGDAQPQHIPQEVQPVIMPGKPYDVDPSSREIRDVGEDDDGVSINSPSPVTTPSPERQQEQKRSVPRLPIYQGGRKDDTGGNSPPPAL